MRIMYKGLIVVGVLAMLPVFILWFNYKVKQDLASYNFNRNTRILVKSMKIFDLKFNSFYIAGQTGSDIYLGNPTAPMKLISINTLLTDTSHIFLKIPDTKINDFEHFRTYIEGNKLYFSNGVNRKTFRGEIGNWSMRPDTLYSPYFQLRVPIGDNSFIYRYINSKSDNNTFMKISGRKRTENSTILEKQVDGKFCTDGMLTFNKDINTLVYLYYYRNEILLIDTNIHVIEKFKTIDPIDTAHFTVQKIKSDNSFTFSSPKLLVNANCSYRHNLFFVESRIMGKGEDKTSFKNSIVIDVYDLKKRKYLYSFYLPRFRKALARQFKIIGKDFFVLSDHYIIKYQLSQI